MGRPVKNNPNRKNVAKFENELKEVKKNICSVFRKKKEASGLKYKELTNRTGITYPTLKKIFEDTEGTGTYSFSSFVKIATALDLPLSVLNGKHSDCTDVPSEEKRNDDSISKKLQDLDRFFPENDCFTMVVEYESFLRIVTLYHFLSSKQKELTIDLIKCFFETNKAS